MSSKPHISILDPIGSHGGMHYYCDNQARTLFDQGHPVTLYSLPASTDTGVPYEKVNTFRRIYGSDPKLVRGLRFISDLTGALVSARRKRSRAMLYHLFKMDSFELFAMVAARALGMKTFGIVHDVARLDKAGTPSKLTKIARHCNLLIVHNVFSLEALERALDGAPANVAVIPSGNYIAQFPPSPPAKATARAALGLPQDKVILLFFGNPRREKGLHVLLEALVPHRDAKGLLVLVAGKMKPDEEAEYRTFVTANGLDARVRFDIGHVADENVANYYRAADMVALPYLRIYESAVALMAMSLGRPVIASDLPPLRDVIGDDQRGLLFTMGDAGALAARIGEVLAAPDMLDELAERAAHYAANDRHWDVTGKMLSEAAEKL
jgi:glycosyltransferase involved in cell wall biosynthesis